MSLPQFDLVIFGGTGDLAIRKLLPALYYSHRDGILPAGSRIFGAGSSSEMPREQYLAKVEAGCRKFVRAADFNEADFQSFAERIHYIRANAKNPADFQNLATLLNESPAAERVFYLSTPPDVFMQICENLGAAGLATTNSRVVLEKPLGHDFASNDQINAGVAKIFAEEQVYRIDHYLGKEPVQNLMALRFSNTIFEPLWRREYIRDVQITVAEQVGVETRAAFYDGVGALRDMVQNHMLQLLCITAMEPPVSNEPDAIRDEKLRVLHSLRPFTEQDVATKVVRGQYKAGAINGSAVPAYLDEPGVPEDSHADTFVALKAEIDNWRWAGVPFFLRTGKRMQEKVAEIVINFKDVPHPVFPVSSGGNRLVIRLQPDESVRLYLMAKHPGDGMNLGQVHLDIDFSQTFRVRQMEAYERLLLDVLRGRQTLFVRRDELDAAWRWVEPIMNAWAKHDERPKPYNAGSWGPAAASTLILRDGLTWSEEN